MSTYTPGPWHWHNGHLTSDLDGQYILMPRPHRGAENPIPINVIREEDAALITAAPDLLEALLDIASLCVASLDTAVTKQGMTQVWDIARAAIARARE